jgi:hypothetical protein
VSLGTLLHGGGVDGGTRAHGAWGATLWHCSARARCVELPAVVGALQRPRDIVDPPLRQGHQAVRASVAERAPLATRGVLPRHAAPRGLVTA